MYCKYCGKLIPDDSIFCNFCGKHITDNPHTDTVEIESETKFKIDNDMKETHNHFNEHSLNQYRGYNKSHISTLQTVGIIIIILGVMGTIYCIIRINTDMTPVGLYGIRGNYKPPFTDYEKQQLMKLFLSIVCWIVGILMCVFGRNGQK